MEQTPAQSAKKDSKGKWIFAIIIIAVALVVHFFVMGKAPILQDWSQDLDGALKQAKDEDQKVLVLFTLSPPTSEGTKLVSTTLVEKQNRKAIDEGKFIKVKQATKAGSPLAKKHCITTFPTILVLSSRGTELNRREGFVGEVSLRRDFLSLKIIHEPKINP